MTAFLGPVVHGRFLAPRAMSFSRAGPLMRDGAILTDPKEDSMTLPEKPTITLITLKWAPPLVRDLRARWALEEAGIPYEVVQIGREEQRALPHLARQP